MFLFQLQFCSCILKWVVDLQQTVRFTITGGQITLGELNFFLHFIGVGWDFLDISSQSEKAGDDETRNKLPINHQENFDLNTVPLNSGTYVRPYFLTNINVSRKFCFLCLLAMEPFINVFFVKNYWLNATAPINKGHKIF